MATIYSTKTQPHKAYFREPQKAAINRLGQVDHASDDLVERILDLDEGKGLVIDRRIIPPEYLNARKFLKHGPEVEVDYDLESVIGEDTTTKMRRRSFESMETPFNAGYVFRPKRATEMRDNRTRKVSLVECLEGARLLAYAHQNAGDIEVGHYHRARAVAKDGATVPVRVPSRRKKTGRYAFDLTSVPLIEGIGQAAVAGQLSTRGHDCPRKNWHIRYSTDFPSDQVMFCAHEVAAYHHAAEELGARGYRLPTELSPFVEPTQLTVDFYSRLLDSVLVKDEDLRAKDGLRKPNKAEEEILLWGLVYRKGFDAAFTREKNKKLKNQDWNLRHPV